jgi:hypothetical protein
MKQEIRHFGKIWICLSLVAAMGTVYRAPAQGRGPKFVVDPSWPKPLPGKWVIGQVSGVCVDAQDHVFIVNRNDMTDKEAEVAQQAPPYIEFDPDGNVVNSFGDWKVVPNVTHGCTIASVIDRRKFGATSFSHRGYAHGFRGCRIRAIGKVSSYRGLPWAHPIYSDTIDCCWRSAGSCRLPWARLSPGCQQQAACREM